MADIRIERKAPLWPWILALVLLIGVVALFWATDDGDEIQEAPYAVVEEAEGEQLANNAYRYDENAFSQRVNTFGDDAMAFVTFYNDVEAEFKGNMALDHEYMHRAITKLAVSANGLVKGYDGVEFAQRQDAMMNLADEITRDPYSTRHADKIKRAFGMFTDIAAVVQDSRFPEMESAMLSLNQKLEAIDPQELTLDQKTEIHAFLSAASETIEAMVEM